eukprot:m.644853 g.644853  ORF g.644853 m.644853 type:complete len:334 (-) comp22650_c0_seq18:1644-2645(-)
MLLCVVSNDTHPCDALCDVACSGRTQVKASLSPCTLCVLIWNGIHLHHTVAMQHGYPSCQRTRPCTDHAPTARGMHFPDSIDVGGQAIGTMTGEQMHAPRPANNGHGVDVHVDMHAEWNYPTDNLFQCMPHGHQRGHVYRHRRQHGHACRCGASIEWQSNNAAGAAWQANEAHRRGRNRLLTTATPRGRLEQAHARHQPLRHVECVHVLHICMLGSLCCNLDGSDEHRQSIRIHFASLQRARRLHASSDPHAHQQRGSLFHPSHSTQPADIHTLTETQRPHVQQRAQGTYPAYTHGLHRDPLCGRSMSYVSPACNHLHVQLGHPMLFTAVCDQ